MGCFAWKGKQVSTLEFAGQVAFMLIMMGVVGFVAGYYWRQPPLSEEEEEKEIIANYMKQVKPYYEARRKRFKI